MVVIVTNRESSSSSWRTPPDITPASTPRGRSRVELDKPRTRPAGARRCLAQRRRSSHGTALAVPGRSAAAGRSIAAGRRYKITAAATMPPTAPHTSRTCLPISTTNNVFLTFAVFASPLPPIGMHTMPGRFAASRDPAVLKAETSEIHRFSPASFSGVSNAGRRRRLVCSAAAEACRGEATDRHTSAVSSNDVTATAAGCSFENEHRSGAKFASIGKSRDGERRRLLGVVPTASSSVWGRREGETLHQHAMMARRNPGGRIMAPAADEKGRLSHCRPHGNTRVYSESGQLESAPCRRDDGRAE